MTTETRDEDLILFPAPKMNNHGLPSFPDSFANNTSKEVQSGSSGVTAVRLVLHLAFSLIRGSAFLISSSCSWEDALGDCGRPCDLLSCLLFSALWLRCSPSIVVQETPSAKDAAFTCSLPSLFEVVTRIPIEPKSLVLACFST